MRQLVAIVAVACVAIACEATSKHEAQPPKDKSETAGEPAPTGGATPPPAAKPEQVALGGGDPCEGGESMNSGGVGKGGGQGVRPGAGVGTVGAGRRGAGNRPGDVEVDGATASGGVDRAVLVRVLRAHAAEFRACYDKQLKSQPDLAGKIVVRFTIAKDGSVTKTEVATSLQADVDACIVRVFAKLRFPEQSAEITISYPLTFAADK